MDTLKVLIFGAEIPSIEVLSFILGASLLLIALIGGGLKIKEISIPHISPLFRLLCGVVGILFLFFAVNPNKKGDNVQVDTSVIENTPNVLNEEKVSSNINEKNAVDEIPQEIESKKKDVTIQENEDYTEKEKSSEVNVYCLDCKAFNIKWIANDIQYCALLIYNPIKGYGKMRVKYLSDYEYITIQEEMYETITEQGVYLKGRNPFNVETYLPTHYIPDNIVVNDDNIQIFDENGQYYASIVPIKDLISILNEFGFTNVDLNF